jgi:hypothetical protein
MQYAYDEANPVALAFKRGQANLIADWLNGVCATLNGFDSADLATCSRLCGLIALEIRKHVVSDATLPANGKKPEPRRIDPNSMIPQPVPPPRGSGPVRLQA